MKLGPSIEYKMGYIFLAKSYAKYDREAVSRPFYKKSDISGSTVSNDVKFAFIVCPSRGLLKYIKTKMLATGFNFLKKLFQKTKRDLDFCMIFEEKYFSLYILLKDQITLPNCFYFLRY